MENNHSVNLAWNHTSIFINGICGSAKSSEDHAGKLYQAIYHQVQNDERRIAAVFNNVSDPTKWDDTAFQEVLRILTRDEMLKPGDGTVLTVAFAHSHGGEVIRQALDTGVLKDIIIKGHSNIRSLPEIYMKAQIESMIQNIRKQTVVVTFGSMSLVPDGYAKLVMNFCSKDDFTALFAQGLLNYVQDGKCTNYRIPEEPQKKLNPDTTIEQILANGAVAATQNAGESSGWSSVQSLLSRSNSASSNVRENSHYFDNYLQKEDMMAYIATILGVKLPEPDIQYNVW